MIESHQPNVSMPTDFAFKSLPSCLTFSQVEKRIVNKRTVKTWFSFQARPASEKKRFLYYHFLRIRRLCNLNHRSNVIWGELEDEGPTWWLLVPFWSLHDAQDQFKYPLGLQFFLEGAVEPSFCSCQSKFQPAWVSISVELTNSCNVVLRLNQGKRNSCSISRIYKD